jgi:hypothetical protein
MRQYNPGSEYFEREQAEAKELNAPDWMLQVLTMNPNYTSWGPHENYMSGDGAGWSSPVFYDSWSMFDFGLDDLNELVNFYFEVEKPKNVAVLNLVLWYIHPRKGASRGVEVKNIQQSDLPNIIKHLKEARDRNFNRFSKLDKQPEPGSAVLGGKAKKRRSTKDSA